jgi:hypothetical protein
MVLVQLAHLNSRQNRSFGLAQQYPLLMSRTVTLGAFIILTNTVILLVL